MNALLSIIIGVVTITPLVLVYWFIPDKVWNRAPAPYNSYLRLGFKLVITVLFLSIVYQALMTHGPRMEVERAQMPAPPERVQVEPVESMFKSRDRSGEFKKRIQDEPVE